MTGDQLHRAPWGEIDPHTLYRLLKLRVDVFVVEQECPYPELDGRDLESGSEHLWFSDADGPTAYLRTLTDPDGALRIGRVCTRADARGRSLAGKLMTTLLAGTDDGRDVVLDAQAHLSGWYARFGFTADGPEYVEDGIPHVPMRRPAGQAVTAER
ncbi:GNAT family N-acetyltransferase [Kineosporia sp. J2-2]|uniref:GNAT family N-acetyltransferase n=1 Tax=Kineosporia corallincola TaxID=2835133 RepID=A0ABS5TE91_9ACTN|nr:GNAT family N-acetyltransferase [Kineosporia corallincola]MBT0769178.1 GNAT family N-acetyltransferase [Kineosporia corallincola]